jgi:maltose O-acetyltransferase
MSEREKMLSRLPYVAADPELKSMRVRARRLTRLYNATTEEERRRRDELLRELLCGVGKLIEIEPPFQVDYGCHLHVGEGFYANFGCVILDSARVTIGDGVMLAPGVHIYTAHHPLQAAERVRPDFTAAPELASPVVVGNRVWIGGRAIICPGVSIGDDSVIGAGSVVVKDVPAGVVAAGNPCKVVRKLR